MPLLLVSVEACSDERELCLAAFVTDTAETDLMVFGLFQRGWTIPRSLLTALHTIRQCIFFGHVLDSKTNGLQTLYSYFLTYVKYL